MSDATDFRLVCYGTGGSYAAAAARVVAEAAAVGVDAEAVAVPDHRSWWANVAHKPRIIRDALAADPRSVLYVDADCTIRGPLAPLRDLLTRFDVCLRHRGPGAREPYNGGVMLLANTPRVRAFAGSWANLVDRYGHRHETCDQGFIAEAAAKRGVTLGPLPPEFNALPSDGALPAVIAHAKSSRENPVLGEWKKCRQLDDRLTARTAAWLKTPARKHVVLVVGNGRGLAPARDREIQCIGDAPVQCRSAAVWLPPDPPAAAVLRAAAAHRVVLVPIGPPPAAGVAELLRREYRPKPSADAPPAGIHAYYAVPGVGPAFVRRELPDRVLAAAVTAAVRRRARQVTVIGASADDAAAVGRLPVVEGFDLEFE